MSVTESLIRGNFLQSLLLVQCSPGCVNTGNKLRMISTILQTKLLLHAFIRPLYFKAKVCFYIQQSSKPVLCSSTATYAKRRLLQIQFGRLELSHGCV